MEERFIKQDIEVYDKNNIYAFDIKYMLHYYSHRVMKLTNKASSCLELGIGDGYTTELLSFFFDKYLVLEGDKKIIERFKHEFPRVNTRIVETYFEEWTTEEKFDAIIIGFVLEHVDDPIFILNKYKKMLKPEGKLFIAVPNAESLNRRVGVYAGLLKDIKQLSENDIKAGHKRYYTLSSLREEVLKAGLVITREEGLFLKPITTAQMSKLNFTKEIVEGYLNVGKQYPELCLGIMMETVIDKK